MGVGKASMHAQLSNRNCQLNNNNIIIDGMYGPWTQLSASTDMHAYR